MKTHKKELLTPGLVAKTALTLLAISFFCALVEMQGGRFVMTTFMISATGLVISSIPFFIWRDVNRIMIIMRDGREALDDRRGQTPLVPMVPLTPPRVPMDPVRKAELTAKMERTKVNDIRPPEKADVV